MSSHRFWRAPVDAVDTRSGHKKNDAELMLRFLQLLSDFGFFPTDVA